MPRRTQQGRRAIRTFTEATEVFAALGVSEVAKLGLKELKGAYRKLARDHHPDRPGNERAAATKTLQNLNGAYEILKRRAEQGGDFEDWRDIDLDEADDEVFYGGREQAPQAGGFARPHEAQEAAQAQHHFMRNYRPGPGMGMPLVVGGEHRPTHATDEAVLFASEGTALARRGAAPARTVGYLVMLVPPDLAGAFGRAMGMGRPSDNDWRQIREWTREQGLDLLYRDMRSQNRRMLGGGGRMPRGYLNRRHPLRLIRRT